MTKINVQLNAEVTGKVLDRIKDGGNFYLYKGWEIAVIIVYSALAGSLATILAFVLIK